MSNFPTPFRGGCLCGSIRYECSAEPETMYICHCTGCRKATGGSNFPAIVVPSSGLIVAGRAPRTYTAKSEAGNPIIRSFCGNCGTTILVMNLDQLPSSTILSAATLDEVSIFQPDIDAFVDSAPHWDVIANKDSRVHERPE